jgi:hypothetical protein
VPSLPLPRTTPRQSTLHRILESEPDIGHQLQRDGAVNVLVVLPMR